MAIQQEPQDNKPVKYVELSKTEKICDWAAGVLIAVAGIGLLVFFTIHSYDSTYLFPVVTQFR